MPAIRRYFKPIAFSLFLCSILSCLTWTRIRQFNLDANLIAAIQHRQFARAMSLVGEGANPNARKDSLDATAPLWKHIESLFAPAEYYC